MIQQLGHLLHREAGGEQLSSDLFKMDLRHMNTDSDSETKETKNKILDNCDIKSDPEENNSGLLFTSNTYAPIITEPDKTEEYTEKEGNMPKAFILFYSRCDQKAS